jgi:hypothetical protein
MFAVENCPECTKRVSKSDFPNREQLGLIYQSHPQGGYQLGLNPAIDPIPPAGGAAKAGHIGAQAAERR